jgi:hypothetical protein
MQERRYAYRLTVRKFLWKHQTGRRKWKCWNSAGIDRMEIDCEDSTGFGSCPVAGYCFRGVESPGSATIVFIYTNILPLKQKHYIYQI